MAQKSNGITQYTTSDQKRLIQKRRGWTARYITLLLAKWHQGGLMRRQASGSEYSGRQKRRRRWQRYQRPQSKSIQHTPYQSECLLMNTKARIRWVPCWCQPKPAPRFSYSGCRIALGQVASQFRKRLPIGEIASTCSAKSEVKNPLYQKWGRRYLKSSDANVEAIPFIASWI